MLTLSGLATCGCGPVSLELGRGEALALLCRPLSSGGELFAALSGRQAAIAGLGCIDGRPIAGPGLGTIRRDSTPRPDPRLVGLASARDPLLAHLDLAANVALGLRIIGHDRDRALARASEMLAWLGLDAVAHLRPTQVSAAERVRAHIARALACRPRLLLLDDPGGGLAPPERSTLLARLRRLILAHGLTAMLATDDPDEALAFGARAGLLEAGGLRQEGSARTLLEEPWHAAVAEAFGHANLLPGQVLDLDDMLDVRLACGARIEAMAPRRPGAGALAEGSPCEVAIRPERLAVAFVDRLPEQTERGDLAATLLDAQPLGERVRLRFRLADGTELVALRPAQAIRGALERDRPALLACRSSDAIAFPQD
jgi:putative spermidine/putrescine transport system ATP-binding protein